MPVERPAPATTIDVLLDGWFPDGDATIRELRGQLQTVRLPAGEKVFRRGDACRNYLVVIEGCVRVQALSPTGREVTLYRVSSGQSCVITTSCLISQESYPAEGVTELPTTALVLAQGAFNEALGRSGAFRQFVFANQGLRLSDLIQRVEDVAFGRVDARLARFLVERASHDAGIVIATHQVLASELGTAREVISRQLKAFERQGWLVVQRGNVRILDAVALARIWKDSE